MTGRSVGAGLCRHHYYGAGTGRRFVFPVSVGAADAASVEMLRHFLGIGYVRRSPRRRPHFDDVATYSVGTIGDLLGVVVPVMDDHLMASHIRDQYLAWRAELLDFWEHRAKRVRSCLVEGCDQPRRAKGPCRHHYYLRYRR
ncbi:MAG: hypothetical protein ACRD0A_05865 [Acidimicrobiales bacterium]